MKGVQQEEATSVRPHLMAKHLKRQAKKHNSTERCSNTNKNLCSYKKQASSVSVTRDVKGLEKKKKRRNSGLGSESIPKIMQNGPGFSPQVLNQATQTQISPEFEK